MATDPWQLKLTGLSVGVQQLRALDCNKLLKTGAVFVVSSVFFPFVSSFFFVLLFFFEATCRGTERTTCTSGLSLYGKREENTRAFPALDFGMAIPWMDELLHHQDILQR